MEKYIVSEFICRVCKKKGGKIVIDLGNQPLANAIINRKEKEKEYPLKVFICSSCKTLQLTKVVNPKILFDKYVWVTGTSNTPGTLITFNEKLLRLFFAFLSKDEATSS